MLHGSTPEAYGAWLRETIRRAAPGESGERLVFVNAWNEWAEGNHLEPGQRWGRALPRGDAGRSAKRRWPHVGESRSSRKIIWKANGPGRARVTAFQIGLARVVNRPWKIGLNHRTRYPASANIARAPRRV